MKKTIAIEIILTLIFAVLLMSAIIAFKYIPLFRSYIDWYQSLSTDYPDYDMVSVAATNYEFFIQKLLIIGIPSLIAAIADLAAIIIIAVKDIPQVKQHIADFKIRRQERRAEHAAVAKRERIDKLQTELDELKKDD